MKTPGRTLGSEPLLTSRFAAGAATSRFAAGAQIYQRHAPGNAPARYATRTRVEPRAQREHVRDWSVSGRWRRCFATARTRSQAARTQAPAQRAVASRTARSVVRERAAFRARFCGGPAGAQAAAARFGACPRCCGVSRARILAALRLRTRLVFGDRGDRDPNGVNGLDRARHPGIAVAT